MQTAPSQEHLHLLGKPIYLLTTELGEPFCEYPYRGNSILMFNGGNETISCEVGNGIVKSINTYKDRRTAPRIKPDCLTRAYLRYGGNRQEATVIDMSVKSVSMKVINESLPAKGELVTFCTTLRSRPFSKVFITLSGHVLRASPVDQSVIIFLYTPFETHSHWALMDYISALLAMQSVGSTVAPPQKSDEEVTVIKSDRCVTCDESACGLVRGNNAQP